MGGKLSSEELSKRHVVIIGGGYAGMELGTILLKWEVPFTIIDPKEYFHHVVGGLRAILNKGESA
jgi:NADH dehydrogenase FAD-containing subunit